MTGFPLIADHAALRPALEALGRASEVALDTEFVRERTYFGRLCLIQLATDEGIWLVDVPALGDLAPLADALARAGLVTVVHAGRQDLELLLQVTGRLPAAVVDTQVAAMLTGRGDQIAYAGLVEPICGVVLEKGHARTDWCRRPLSEAQLAYAADDVRYLLQVWRKLDAELTMRGRRSWLDAELDGLLDRATYEIDDRAQWRRIKARTKLKPRALAVLRELAAWREHEARTRDLPRSWVLKDEVLVDLARRAPRKSDELAEIRGLPEGWIERSGKALLDLIGAAGALPPDQWPQESAPARPDPKLEPVVDLLVATARSRALAEGIALPVVTGRDELRQLAAGERDLPVLKGWRRRMVGDELLRVAAGETALRADDGGIVLETP
ncbi:MAG: ribonuclease D [Chromatiales bacterium]|nr:ribonuclease D [Chromatiales bacterium]